MFTCNLDGLKRYLEEEGRDMDEYLFMKDYITNHADDNYSTFSDFTEYWNYLSWCTTE